MPASAGRKRVAVDMVDLIGLRGIAAVWIMLFHCFLFCRLQWDFQGSTLMPLFFLLSGFSLSVGYMNRFVSNGNYVESHLDAVLLEDIEIHTELEQNTQLHQQQGSSVRQYFYNRIIRVMPVFYITFAFAIPITVYGYGGFDPKDAMIFTSSIVQNIIPTNTWTLFLAGLPIDGPSWTVCTLWFFWVLFPYLQRFYERQEDTELLSTIVRCFWFQLCICLIVFPVVLIGTGSGSLAFWWATGVPYSRLPVFIMGMCAGILCSRHATAETMPWFSESGTFIPWGFWCWCSCPGASCCSATNVCCLGWQLTTTEVDFGRTCVRQASKLLFLTALWSVLSISVGNIASNWWFQAINVFAQLDLIVALTRAKGSTLCSVVLRASVVQWLGELSMSIYLVHFPIIYYLCWILHGDPIAWPPSQDCAT